MSFTVYRKGIKFICWFNNIDQLIEDMLKNPQDNYWRNK